MNGRAAKRIRRASRMVMWDMGKSFRATVKTLKAEYKVLPYHRRVPMGYHIETHAEANKSRRGQRCQD
jgi:hypothetical protein